MVYANARGQIVENFVFPHFSFLHLQLTPLTVRIPQNLRGLASRSSDGEGRNAAKPCMMKNEALCEIRIIYLNNIKIFIHIILVLTYSQ
jgi:hypothetical protein